MPRTGQKVPGTRKERIHTLTRAGKSADEIHALLGGSRKYIVSEMRGARIAMYHEHPLVKEIERAEQTLRAYRQREGEGLHPDTDGREIPADRTYPYWCGFFESMLKALVREAALVARRMR